MPAPSLAFAICGAIVLIFGAASGFWDIVQRLVARVQQQVAIRMLGADPAPAFLTTRGAVVVWANDAALRQYRNCRGRLLEDVFGHLLADPGAILTPLAQKAKTAGCATDDIVTRGGHFLLRVVYLGPLCQLWSLPQQDGSSLAHDLSSEAVPAMTVAPDGRIIGVNETMRQTLGREVLQLTDVIGTYDLRNGETYPVAARRGAWPRTAAVVPMSDGREEVYLLPPPDQGGLPRKIAAGWDGLEDLPVPLLKIGHDGSILASNREARLLLGIQQSGGCQLADILDIPGRPIMEWLAQAIGGQGTHTSEFLRGRGDQRETFVQMTLSPSGSGDDLHLIGVLNDVTELKTLEAQFVQSQKMQAIGQLAGGVAHDFNNLLTAISGHCDLLLLRHDEGHQDYADLIQIHQNTNRAASLVGQLLAYSRKQTLQMETVDLRDTLSELTHLLNRLVGEKVSLTLEHEADLFPIRADKRQLEQVFMNLVVNARDAMAGAGEIRIKTNNMTLASEMRKDRAIVPPGDYVVVNVIDEGSGIAPDKLPKIFEPFFTTKRIGEGTGLGLSTAYGIVKQTGGYIFVETELGEGTTFSLLFPRHIPLPDGAVAAMKNGMLRKSQMKGAIGDGVILLVEDEAPVRAFASRALRMKGFTVLEADCAETALDMLADRDLRIDLFVTDVIMPGLDGPSWVRKALVDRPETRVIFVSGYPEDAFQDGSPAIPQAIFLQKPFSLKELTQIVQVQLQRQPEPV